MYWIIQIHEVLKEMVSSHMFITNEKLLGRCLLLGARNHVKSTNHNKSKSSPTSEVTALVMPIHPTKQAIVLSELNLTNIFLEGGL